MLNSCTSSLDTEQANDIAFDTKYNVSLVYFKLHNNNLTENTVQLDFTNIDLFKESDITTRLNKIVLKFKIENTFNKQFDLKFLLMENEVDILETIPFTINEDDTITLEKTYYKNTTAFEDFIKTRRITVIGSMLSNANLTTDDMQLHFQSALDLYFTITNE